MKYSLASLKNSLVLLSASVISFTVFSCSDESLNQPSALINSEYTSSSVSEDIPSFVTDEFKNLLAKQRVTLSAKDYSTMRDMVRVKAIGQWTPGPENDSSANLTKHFTKHGGDFKPAFKTEKDYFNSAIKFANTSCDTCNYYLDLNSYKTDKIISVDKWNSKSHEFTVVRANGQTATYYLNDKLKADRFILIPEEMR